MTRNLWDSMPTESKTCYNSRIPPKLVAAQDENQQRKSRPTMKRWSYGSGRGSFTRRIPSKRRVKFSADGDVTVDCTYEYLDAEEISLLWYRSKDYESFERDKKKTLAKLRKNKGDVTALDPRKYCLRGVEEYQCLKIYCEKRNKRLEYSMIILEEQKRQRLLHVVDSNAYAKAGRDYTAWATECALKAGQRDENHAWPQRVLSGQRMKRCDSQRWLPIDSESDPEEVIPPRCGRRDSLDVTKLRSCVAALDSLLDKNPGLHSTRSDNRLGGCDWGNMSLESAPIGNNYSRQPSNLVV